ncbi:MAG: efflux RND transporter periplasmic adaptor subunit [Mucilaginibacter sp.]|uniref:efflux RND transporter periplasmic adaptor subunit n=1 Tax=Mucilaginibacter sp. TaxID=1882438 RepID=UPI0031A44E55
MKKSYLILAIFGPLVYSCTVPKPGPNKIIIADAIPVKVIKLKQEASTVPISVSGRFTTDNETELSFKTSGIISSILVKEGDAIHQGQLLATLNPTEINAQLQQSQLNSEKAERDYQRIQNLYRDSVATLEQLQNSKTSLQLAQQQLNLVKFNRQYSEIHAIQNGFVLKKLANAGQQVGGGSPILEVNGTQHADWILRVGISDVEWAAIKMGYKAKIESTAIPGQSFEGMVTRKSEGVDATSGTFTADITMSGNVPRSIASGMFGKASISIPSTAKTNSNWRVPYEALLDGDSNIGYVFVTDNNKTAHKVKVQIGGIEKDVAIITSGLENAKGLIVSGSAYLTDNSPIILQSTVNSNK